MSFYGQQIFNIPGWLLNDGTIDPSRLPDFTDGVVIGYYKNGNFYADENSIDAIARATGKIYIDLFTNNLYYYNKENDTYIKFSKDMVVEDQNNDGNVVISFKS